MSEAKILTDFKAQVREFFSSEEEMNTFLTTPSHIFGQNKNHEDLTPKEWLLFSRRKDRLQYAVNAVKELKTYIGFLE